MEVFLFMAKERAIGYIRVSTKEQARDGYSLANQRKEIKDYCRKNKIELVVFMQMRVIQEQI